MIAKTIIQLPTVIASVLLKLKAPFGKGSCPRTGTEGLYHLIEQSEKLYIDYYSESVRIVVSCELELIR